MVHTIVTVSSLHTRCARNFQILKKLSSPLKKIIENHRFPISLCILIWNKQNVSHGPYLCPKHTKCHSCASTVPGNGLSVRLVFFYLNLQNSSQIAIFFTFFHFQTNCISCLVLSWCLSFFFLCLDPISVSKIVFMTYYVLLCCRKAAFFKHLYFYFLLLKWNILK